MAETTFHIDRVDAPKWMTTAFTDTPEGFLQGRAVVTTTGIFTYLDSQGNTIRELRLPEEVFKPAFLDSLKLKSVSLDHPKEMVSAANIDKYQVGVLGTNPSTPGDGTSDNYSLSIDMVIQRADAVKAVKQGKRQLSVGYRCDLEKAAPGAMWCGQPYDLIQRNLIANHVAIVDKARAGDMASIRMDSAEAHIQIEETVDESTNVKTEDGMADELFKSVKLDGVEYKAEAKVAEALHVSLTRADSLQVEVDALSKKVSTLDAEKDVQKERADALDVELAEIKKSHMDSSKVAELVKARVQLEATALKVGVVLADGMDDVAVMTAVVKQKSPKANLEGKDAVYIKARFDGIVEDMAVEVTDSADSSVRAPAGSVAHADSEVSAKDGAKRYRENLVSQGKEKK